MIVRTSHGAETLVPGRKKKLVEAYKEDRKWVKIFEMLQNRRRKDYQAWQEAQKVSENYTVNAVLGGQKFALIIPTKPQSSDQPTKPQNFAVIIPAKPQSEIPAADTLIPIEQDNPAAVQPSFPEMTRVEGIQFVLNEEIIYMINLRQLR